MEGKAGKYDLTFLQLFKGESPQAVEWVRDVAWDIHLRDDGVLLEPGQENHALYFVLEGRLRIELATEDRAFITYIEPGDCVGELSVLDGKPTSARVVAHGDTWVLALDRADLWRLINTSHTVARNLLYMLSNRIRQDDQALTDSFVMQQRYARSARIDTLTGLYNRYWLEEMLPRLVERAQTDKDDLGMLMIDVDRFKQFNDTHGHLGGDEALRSLGIILLANLRPDDSAVRYGGEEFVILLPGLNRRQVVEVAERLCEHVRLASQEKMSGKQLPGITISVGVAMLKPEQTGEVLIAEADAALYQAKHAGRDQVFVQA